jgi:hypothetical protein
MKHIFTWSHDIKRSSLTYVEKEVGKIATFVWTTDVKGIYAHM